MRNFIFYNPDTGRVLSSHSVPDEFDTSVFREPGEMKELPAYLQNCGEFLWDGMELVHSPVRDMDYEWVRVRAGRDKLLRECDWVRLRAMDSGEAVPAAWLAYRQALRDITSQADPFSIVWPEAPRE